MLYRLQTKKSFSSYEDSIWTFFWIPKSVTIYNLCSGNQYPKEFPWLGQDQNWKWPSGEWTLLKKNKLLMMTCHIFIWVATCQSGSTINTSSSGAHKTSLKIHESNLKHWRICHPQSLKVEHRMWGKVLSCVLQKQVFLYFWLVLAFYE